MLRRVVEHARFIEDIRQMLRMARRESVVTSLLNVQQFIEGISIVLPRCAFLIGAEQIAFVIESKADRKTNSRANRFAF